MKTFMTKAWVSIAVMGSAALLSGCGKQAFVVSSTSEEQQAPGNFMVPPKVDILLVQDDSGSMKNINSAIADQMPEFLSALSQRGWDYHFATIPLTTMRDIEQVQASRYDLNWGAQWLAPYPGATADALAADTVDAFAFRTPDSYRGFVTEYQNGGAEPGLKVINDSLRGASTTQTGFMRQDAMLVVFVVGNGNDNSGINYCQVAGLGKVPCSTSLGHPVCTSLSQTNCDSRQLSLTHYKNQIRAIKPNASQIKFFAAVAANNNFSSSCMGGNANAGDRYMNVASSLGGASIDLCSNSVNSALDAFGQHLHASKLAMRTRYLFIQGEPDLASVRVVRNPGGYSGGEDDVIPQDPINGWTYAGHVQNVYTIDAPVPMNLASGYAIELHGTAKLMGDDTATVSWRPAGAHDSVSQ